MTTTLGVTVVLPCLNEAETLEICIKKAKAGILETGFEGEIIVADNGSSDGSQKIALDNEAKVISVSKKSYGAAIRAGIDAAKFEYILMADSDDSYDLKNIPIFINELHNTDSDLVMGNRFQGGIAPGAMPWLHKHLGNPVLSFIGRLFFGGTIGDFHCGMRAFRKSSVQKLGLTTTGMEFASEIIVKSILSDKKIVEVPTSLKKDGRSRPPHLRTWRDGWRHLRFLLSYSPRWLFFYPGIASIAMGVIFFSLLIKGPINFSGIQLSTQTLIFSSFMILLGQQLIWFSVLSKNLTRRLETYPIDKNWQKILRIFNQEMNLIYFFLILLIGIIFLIASFKNWANTNFGELNYVFAIKNGLISGLLIFSSLQAIFFHFLLGVTNVSIAQADIFWKEYNNDSAEN